MNYVWCHIFYLDGAKVHPPILPVIVFDVTEFN